MHENVITDAFSQTDGNLYGTSAMIAYATSGYFVSIAVAGPCMKKDILRKGNDLP